MTKAFEAKENGVETMLGIIGKSASLLMALGAGGAFYGWVTAWITKECSEGSGPSKDLDYTAPETRSTPPGSRCSCSEMWRWLPGW